MQLRIYRTHQKLPLNVHKLGMICNKQSSLMSISSVSRAFSYTSPSAVLTHFYFSCLLPDTFTGLVIGLKIKENILKLVIVTSNMTSSHNHM